MCLEYPLAWRDRRPGPRHAHPAVMPKKQDAHPHVGSASEPYALERHAHLDDVTLCIDASGTLPHPVGSGILVGAGVERIDLDPARIDEHVIRNLTGMRRVEADANPVVV